MLLFHLNDILLALSYVVDFIEMDILGVTSNHSKRVAYISLKIAQEIGLSPEECFDIVALSVLHDNGFSEKVLHSQLQGNHDKKIAALEKMEEHCIIGEENIKDFPFITDVTNIIINHHERYDGKGFFKIQGENIPIMAQIISFADTIDLVFNLKEKYKEKENKLLAYLEKRENKLASTRVLRAFYTVSQKPDFELALTDKFIDNELKKNIPSFGRKLSYQDIRGITKVFSKIIDSKTRFTAQHSSGLSNKVFEMAEFYKIGDQEKLKLIIAADLHDIGKLTIPDSILEKPGELNNEEFAQIKTHTYYTRMCLETLDGFEDITEWASNHHEKLSGVGYPYKLTASDLDFNSRLMGCLDIYQALTEDRPYRLGLSHKETMEILYKMVKDNLIDGDITKDIDLVFG